VDFNRRDGPRPPDQEDLHVYSTARLLAVKPSHWLQHSIERIQGSVDVIPNVHSRSSTFDRKGIQMFSSHGIRDLTAMSS